MAWFFPIKRRGRQVAAGRRARGGVALLALAAAGLGWGVLPGLPLPAARAQTAAEDSVMGRARPDFDPIGIEIFFDDSQPAPPITVFPTLDVRSGYDSNVFRENADAKADYFWEVSPALRVTNTEQQLALEAAVSATVRRNLEYESNDFEDYDVYGQASYFLLDDSDIMVQLGYSRSHEDRSDPDSTGPGENIIQFDRFRAIAASRNRFGDFLVNPTLEYYYYDYHGGSLEDERDHWEGVARARLGYEFEPGYVAFLEPAYNLRRYDAAADSLGFTRDSWGWQTVAGLSYNVSAVTSAEAYVGYFQQKYEDAGLSDAGGLTFGGSMTWNPLDVLTVNLAIDRSVQESTLSGVSGTVATLYSLGVDYELSDSLLLTSNGTVSTSDFEGATREDVTYVGGAALVYLLNEYARARLGARYETRKSNLDVNDYDAAIVEARLSLQY